MTKHQDILIRVAGVEEILDLRWTILRAGLPREAANFDGDDEPTTHHFAGFVGTEAVACASFLRRPFGNDPAWQLRGMAVRADLQSRGVGARLLEFAEHFVLVQDHSNLLWCNARVPAARFYERKGWKTVSEPFDIPHAGQHVKMIKRTDVTVR